jgi:hypothetical protein
MKTQNLIVHAGGGAYDGREKTNVVIVSQKRPTIVSKESYYSVKRDLL